jgi:hypothetical protein
VSKLGFKPGYVGGWTQEERLFAIKLLGKVKPFVGKLTEHEKRMFRRLIMRFMGRSLHRFPLHVKQECPVCERAFMGNVIQRHVEICKAKVKLERQLPKPDLSILEML